MLYNVRTCPTSQDVGRLVSENQAPRKENVLATE